LAKGLYFWVGKRVIVCRLSISARQEQFWATKLNNFVIDCCLTMEESPFIQK
jgi:hypothetical protein